MTSSTDPREEDFQAASSQLSAGLRTCRSVVSNYRSLIVGDGDSDPSGGDFAASGESPDVPDPSGLMD